MVLPNGFNASTASCAMFRSFSGNSAWVMPFCFRSAFLKSAKDLASSFVSKNFCDRLPLCLNPTTNLRCGRCGLLYVLTLIFLMVRGFHWHCPLVYVSLTHFSRKIAFL